MSDLENNLPMADAGAADPPTIPTEADFEAKYPNRPRNVNPTLPFRVLYQDLFEPLLDNKRKRTGVGLNGTRSLKPHEIRRNIIDRFIARWRNEVGPDIWPAFRLILCEKDRDRNVYHLKEQKIGKLLVKVMKIARDSEDGNALIHWRQPGTWSRSAGDFALRCYEIIKKRPMLTTPGNLTIAQVNEMLDQLSQATGEEQQLPILTNFYNNMCAEELKWLVRIILKQMKVGATEKTFFDAWHPDADALFNVSSSLRRVCWELFDTDFRMQDDGKGVKLMSCFQPQLAQFQKKQLEHVVKAMGSEGEEFWIEEKLDGERMQMHFSNGEFRWWSRKAKEYTHLYGSSFETGSVARFATDAFDKRVKSIILDGEMITWDPKLDCIVGFGTLKTAAIETSNNPVATDLHRPLFRVFDILYLNGTSLLHYTLAERRHALAGVLKNVSRRIEIHPYLPATTKAEIESELRKVIASSSEGLVIKNPRSQYQLNDRNDDWVKVKPEYMTEFGESLDCLVVGGYWGSGHRGNILSSYLCALRVGTEADPMKFWSFCRVGGGFTAHDYSTIAHRTDGHWVTWDSKNPPSFLELAGGRREFEKPDMWIHPERSFVVEIKAASVATSDMFRTNLTLRFPRFKKLRTDKSWQTSLSFQEFLQLRANADREAAKKSLEVEQRRGQRKRVKKEFTVAGGEAVPQFAAPPEGNPHLFEGKAFYVMTDSAATGSKKKSKAELEALIKAFGGRIFQSEKGAAGLRVIGERNTVKVSALKKLGNHDIIRPQWVLDCIRQQEWLPLEPRYMFHIASDDTRELVETGVDGWGDSYARDLVDAEELRSLMEGMRTPLPGDRGIVVTFRDSCFPTEMLTAMPGWLLANCKVFVDPSVSGIARTLAQFAGATLVPDLFDAGGISHVLVGRDTLPDRVREIRELIAMWNGPIPRIVMDRWVDECISEKTRLDEERFVAAA